MAWDWIVKVFHIYREANQCADILAKKGHSIATGVTLFESAPAFLSHVFFGDISRAHQLGVVSVQFLLGFYDPLNIKK